MLPRQVETLRATAHEFDESARLVTAFQSGAEAHEGMKAGSLASRLGMLLIDKNIKVNDLKNK